LGAKFQCYPTATCLRHSEMVDDCEQKRKVSSGWRSRLPFKQRQSTPDADGLDDRYVGRV
jgi:hypothetical protein